MHLPLLLLLLLATTSAFLLPPPRSPPQPLHLTPPLTIPPIPTITGTVTLPGSKSLSNRLLLLAALSEGTTTVTNLLESDDIRYMLDALDVLGVKIDRKSGTTVVVSGSAGPLPIPSTPSPLTLNLGNAGTAMRPLAAALSYSVLPPTGLTLDGVPRMRERPIGDLIHGLEQLGGKVRVTGEGEEGCPPVFMEQGRVEGGKNDMGGTAKMSGKMSVSFQAICLAL